MADKGALNVRCHGVDYIRTGDCKRCGSCEKPECVHFSFVDGLATCAIQDKKKGVCETFPQHPFLRVIKEGICGFTFEPATGKDRIQHQRLIDVWDNK